MNASTGPERGGDTPAATLGDLGWRPFYQRQLSETDLETLTPVRVTAVHRDRLLLTGPGTEALAPIPASMLTRDEDRATVGDWVLVEPETHRLRRRLERQSLFKRRAPGTGRQLQLIAANVDTVFVVTSCNQDFNLARLERYLVLAREAGVMPVVVLTKTDLCEDPALYVQQASRLPNSPLVEALNALDPESAARLAPYCGKGQTVALLGSSGVGKSTLVNSLTGRANLVTQGIREDDARGRHTTTGRALHRLTEGGWLLDTPGMRELQLTDVAAGLSAVFEEVEALTERCRYNDCGHDSEPGCAIRAALESGELDPAMLARWRKLRNEERRNTESLAQRRSREKDFGKMVRSVMREKRKRGSGR